MLLLALMVPWTAKAQTPTIETIGNGTYETTLVFPGRFNYNYTASLYKPDMADALNSDFNLSSIAYDVVSSGATIDELTIWVKDVDASEYSNTSYISKYNSFSFYIEGATQVYATTTPFNLAEGWNTFNFTTNFSHRAGKALLVAVRGVSNTLSSSPSYRYTYNSKTVWYNRLNSDPGYNYTYGDTDFTFSGDLANIQLGVTYATGIPSDLTVTYPEGIDTEVTLGWTENGEATAWQICLNDDETNLIEANSNPFSLTGLTPETTYTAKVRANHGDTQSDWSTAVSFTPTLKTVLGTATGAVGFLPCNPDYNYSLTQQIYTVAELGNAADLISIDFYNDGADATTRNLQIYMTHTDQNAFASLYYDWINVAPTDLVFSGTVTFVSKGWTSIVLDTPFAYDGQHNVVITVDDNTGSTAGQSIVNFLCYSVPGAGLQSKYFNDDYNHNYDPTNNPGSSTYALNQKNHIRVMKVQPPTDLTVSNVTSQSATLGWTENGTATSWEICLNGDETNLIDATTNPFTLTNLTPNTTYTAKVRAVYDAGHTTWSNEVSFTPYMGTMVCYRENFDSYTNAFVINYDEMPTSRILPEGWTFINTNTHNAQFPCMINMGDDSRLWISEPNGLWFHVDPEDDNDIYAIMPSMVTGGKQVMMYVGFGGDFTVGLMTNPTDANTFVACSPTYSTAPDTPRQLIQCTLTGQGNYIAIKYNRNGLDPDGDEYGYVDNIVVYNSAPITILDPTYAMTDNPVSQRLPFVSTRNSYSQQIYTTDELGEAGFITSIGFMMTNDVSALANLTIGIVSTDQQERPSCQFGIEDRVFFGPVDFTQGAGWYNIPLDHPFYYDGQHNICIYVDITEPIDESMSFHCIPTSSLQADANGQWIYQKNNLMFTKDESVSVCTNLSASPHYFSADLSWMGVQDAQSYTVRYRPTQALGTPVYTEGFENGMDGWSLLGGYEGAAGCSGITTNAAEAHSGNCYFLFKSEWNGNYTQCLVSPQLPNLSEESTVEVYCRSELHYDSFGFDVGVSSTDNQISSFHWIATWTSGRYWNRCAMTIPAETKYICIRYTNQNVRGLLIDDIIVRNPVEWQTATTDQTNLHLTGLSAVTEYHAQVRSNLPDENWSQTARFTTQDGPTDLQCTSVGITSAPLSWVDDYTPEVWQICINGDEDNLIEVTEKQHTLTSLTTMTSYTAKVRGKTGTELSDWSNGIVINTSQEPVSLPYSTDFETASDWYLINGDLTNAWAWGEAAHNGEGTHGIYISNDGGPSHAYDNVSAARVYAVKAFNFEAGVYDFTFDWKANGTRNYDYLRVGLVPANQNLTAGSGNIGMLPSSWISVDGGSQLCESTEWNTFSNEVIVPSAGIYYLVFLWQNKEYGYGENPPAAIDNVSITVCECPKPVNLSVSVAEQANTAELSWTEMGEAAQWQVCLDDDEDNLIDVTTNPCTLTGFAFESQHTVKVRANCGDSNSDWSNPVSFEVTQKILIGGNDVNETLLPFHNQYKYSLTQQIYTADEFGDAGQITSIDFKKYWDNGCIRTIDIYMVHTDKAIFETTNDWIHVTDADLVFSGTVNFGNDVWTTIVLDTPFNYDGQHNVALIVDDNTGNIGTVSYFLCNGYDGADYRRAICYYDDTNNYDPKGTLPWGKTRLDYRTQIRIRKVVNHTTEIAGFGTGTGNWHLVASPLAAATYPTDVTNMIGNTYDLYRFNQSAALEWENWKAEGDNYHFNLENGKGYLYANSENVTLVFSGVPYSGNGQIPLAYDATAQFAGWNLIGNPFGTAATIDKPFYRMNEDGTALSAQVEAGNTVEAMEGVFVQATATGQSANFTAATRGNAKAAEVLQISLAKVPEPVEGREGPTRNSGVSTGSTTATIDNAIIRFDEGQTLGKFSLREGSSKVYIPAEGKDLAVAQAEGQVGEIPVNFKAEANGTYTLSFTSEEVTFSYLHLIDNMTGEDVDLLANPTYSFDARTSDYESRFHLVFATGGSVDGDSFGFINGMGNLTIFGIEGEATLQVIDVTGRMLSSETFSGSYEKRLNVAPGVYMLRLIQGNDVKV